MFGSEYYTNNYLLWKLQISFNKVYEQKFKDLSYEIEELSDEIEKLNKEIEKLKSIILTLV